MPGSVFGCIPSIGVRRRSVVAAFALLAVPAPTPEAAAQVRDRPDPREMVLRAERREGPIEIDGSLDEPDWKRAPVATGFVQREPYEGEPAMEDTEVRVLYDKDDIYIGARLFDSDTTRIARQLTRRGETGRAAGYLEFSLDPNFDRTTGYTFRVTAAGVHRDEYDYDDTRSDRSWDGIWESAVRIDEDGWTAEVRIPLSQLRFDPSPEPQTWGVNFARRRIADNERTEWAFSPRGMAGGVSRWGRLEGLVLSEQRRHVEVLPFVMGGMERAEPAPGDPFFDGSNYRGQTGADIRLGLGSNFRVDMTLNPDFGQVQVDPRVINLSAYETFYPERRPFFTRDDRALQFDLGGGRSDLFYSRRIGRSPRGDGPPEADYIAAPGETSILGAGKVTGRTAGGLTVGILGAVTAEERGRAYHDGDDRVDRFVAEPRSQFGVFRLRQDLREGRSRLGGVVTVVNRELNGEEGLAARLPDGAYTGGLDFEHTWADREWALEGYLARSRITGDPEALLQIQRSSNHYFQRPDQNYMTLDPERTSLFGTEWRLRLAREGGRHWTGNAWVRRRTPGFEVNDLGFSTDRESIAAGARLGYSQPDPGDVLRSWGVNLETSHAWRNSVRDDLFSASAWGDAYRSGSAGLSGRATFLNYWRVGLGLDYEPETLSDGLTRGGPLMVRPGTRGLTISGSTDRRDDITYGASFRYDDGLRGGNGVRASFDVSARPSQRVAVKIDPSYHRSHTLDQYVGRIQDPDFTATYGDRYFFADLRREEISLEIRFNYIFSPDLSLEFFAQPLIAVGDFRTYKQLARPASFDFLEFQEGTAVEGEGGISCDGGALCRVGNQVHLDLDGTGTADATVTDGTFNVRSLRGSAVLRWEYRPGSRVFLVWQQQRSGREFLRDLDLSRDAGALLETPPRNVFMIKVDYWFNL